MLLHTTKYQLLCKKEITQKELWLANETSNKMIIVHDHILMWSEFLRQLFLNNWEKIKVWVIFETFIDYNNEVN
jgi:trehalose/maltose hydrolase-like predicted phosphorylase